MEASGGPRYRLGLWLFLFVAAVQLVTMGGHTYSPDEEERYYVTRGLIEQKTLAVSIPSADLAPITGDHIVNGRNYSKFGIGQSLAMLPLYVAGTVFARLFLPSAFDYLTRFAIGFLNPLVTAATALLVLRTGMALGYPRRTATWLALIYAFLTIAWPYSKTTFSEPLVGLALLGALHTAVRFRQSGRLRWVAGAGLWLSLGALVRADSLIAAVPLAAYLGLAGLGNWRPGNGPRRLFAFAAALSFGFGLAGALIAAYNLARFGSPFETGYSKEFAGGFTTPLPTGLYGLLLSPGRSIFVYSPPLVLSILSARAFFRRHRREALLILCIAASEVLFFARWWSWHGGGSWGPRLLVPIVPLLLLPAGIYLWSLEGSGWRRRLVLGAVLVAAALVQFDGVSVNFDTVNNSGFAPSEDALLFDPRYSPPLGHLYHQAEYAWAWWNRIFGQTGTGQLAPDDHGEGGARPPAVPPYWDTNPKQLFGWFYDPSLKHFDFWWWYWYFSGLPRGALLGLIPLLAIALVAGRKLAAGLARDGSGASVPATNRGASRSAFPSPAVAVGGWFGLALLVPAGILLADGVQAALPADRRTDPASSGQLRAAVVPGDSGTGAVPTSARHAVFGDRIVLTRAGHTGGRIAPGGTVTVSLEWRLMPGPEPPYQLFAQLLAEDGTVAGQVDRVPPRTKAPVPREGVLLTDTFGLPVRGDAPPGRYQVVAGFYRVPDLTRLKVSGADAGPQHTAVLGNVKISGPTLPPTAPAIAEFGGQIALTHIEFMPNPAQPGAPLTVELGWLARRRPDADYTVSVQVRTPAGAIVAQQDAPPRQGVFPTSDWEAGDLVSDSLRMALPNRVPSEVHAYVVVYEPRSGQRLPVGDADAYDLGPLPLPVAGRP